MVRTLEPCRTRSAAAGLMGEQHTELVHWHAAAAKPHVTADARPPAGPAALYLFAELADVYMAPHAAAWGW